MLLQFNYQLLKKVEGCTMGGPLLVTHAEIHMIMRENDVVIPRKRIFCTFVDGFISRRRKNDLNELFFK